MRRSKVLGAALLAILMAQGMGTRTARAQTDSVQLANEEMMEDAANENLNVAALFGFGTATLSYTSQITTGTNSATFNYSTLPGQTYLGQPISVTSSGSGIYDPSSSQWT